MLKLRHKATCAGRVAILKARDWFVGWAPRASHSSDAFSGFRELYLTWCLRGLILRKRDLRYHLWLKMQVLVSNLFCAAFDQFPKDVEVTEVYALQLSARLTGCSRTWDNRKWSRKGANEEPIKQGRINNVNRGQRGDWQSCPLAQCYDQPMKFNCLVKTKDRAAFWLTVHTKSSE